MRSGIPTNTRQSLRRRSPAKRKHLGMMGTPVWCLSRALRCLSVLSGPGCSGQPDRIDRLGYPILPGQVTVAGDVMCCRSRGMVPVADRCSEYYTVRARGLFRRKRGRCSVKDFVLGERPALNTAEYSRRQYFVIGEYVNINIHQMHICKTQTISNLQNTIFKSDVKWSPIISIMWLGS
ncbi:hypothetical protein TIFTF001_002352 [Ficus carica]|uniref:Uncharacterized protein n=1 Tax=Ficus carica TaxID=3494 RepID=A0AA88CT68_FICCA|nr:hypothetical protein TIFTF001_002352 [Ficus carica]